MMLKRIAIIGSRGYSAPHYVRWLIRKLPSYCIIVSGGCPNSPDEWAEKESDRCGLSKKIFPVTDEDWQTFGKSAGPRRNKKIVDYADIVIAFWDGKSRGTDGTVRMAKVAEKPCYVINEYGFDLVSALKEIKTRDTTESG